MVDQSSVAADLHRTRNMRLAFKDGFLVGGAKGRTDDPDRGSLSGRQDRHARATHRYPALSAPPHPPGSFITDNILTFSKVDAVFK